jgi:GAF domain-containing protein
VLGERLRRFEAVTDARLGALELDELLVELLDRVRELLGVDTAAVLLLDPSTHFLVATAARGVEQEVHQGVRVPIGKGFAGKVAAERRPVIVENIQDSDVLNPILEASGIRSLLGVPLLAGSDVLGVLHVGMLTARSFTGEDAELLRLIADRIALAIQARTSRAEREAASALQRSLWPDALPEVAGLEFAARYVPGGRGKVGGDWYEVLSIALQRRVDHGR